MLDALLLKLLEMFISFENAVNVMWKSYEFMKWKYETLNAHAMYVFEKISKKLLSE